MAGFDYDVVIIGSGFGGSVAALRAAEKGYRVGVMESGRRWKDEDIPKTQWDLPHFLWFPAAELYGIQRIEYLDDVLVLSGAGVGGGSHVYANTLYVPPKQFFDARSGRASPTGPTNWRRISTRRPGCSASFATRTCPPTSIGSCSRSRSRWDEGETFNKAPVGVYFGSPGVEADDPYFGGVGPRRTGCISCGKCNIGCGHNAKNKLTTNYLYLAEKLGVEVHELTRSTTSPARRRRVRGARASSRLGAASGASPPSHLHRRAGDRRRPRVRLGEAAAPHAAQGPPDGLSSELGQRARTNSEQLLAITRTHGEWERDPEKIRLTPGSVAITSGVWPDAVTSIEPVYWGVGNDLFAFLVTYHQHGEQKHPTASWLKELVEAPARGAQHRRPAPLV